MRKLNKTRAQVDADYFQRHGAERQRTRRNAIAAPKLRLYLMQMPQQGPWAQAQILHAIQALGAARTLMLLRQRQPALNALAAPLVEAMAPTDFVALEQPYHWLKAYLTRAGLTRGDYLALPNC